ncbi:recombinase family protein [Nitrosospira multiformis]|uniref:recombinase family protein n=1 Tax=Nitrosospira multiformis TaxID=1231 RepID=UPI003524DFAF
MANNRPGLFQAIAAVGAGNVLVVKLDRLSRSLSFLIELIDKLRKDQAGSESLSMVSTPRPQAGN